MKVLVIGKGGREHALAWKLARSPRLARLYVAPGNAGTAELAENVPIDPLDFDHLIRFAREHEIDLTVVGPEDPLVAGVVDAFRAAGLRIFGPEKLAARLEGSKVFAKKLMRHADVPTAEFRTFDTPNAAKTYIDSRDEPLVVKADGLAAGKGVCVCDDRAEAHRAIDRLMIREEFGKAGREVVVEKRLTGPELSVFALVAGRTVLMLPPSQDHKRLLDGDAGPNTGGMGAFSPAPAATPELLDRIGSEVFVPIVHAMKRQRCPFRGLLFAGLMLTAQGPKVLEFNVRFGDPETQVLMPRLKTDLLDLLEAVVDDRLDEFADQVEWDDRPAVAVVLASDGYPGPFAKGKVIRGLPEAAKLPDVCIFHAGTAVDTGRIVTDGGRVLAVSAIGDTLQQARDRAYEAVGKIQFTGVKYRTDIAAVPSDASGLPAASPAAAVPD